MARLLAARSPTEHVWRHWLTVGASVTDPYYISTLEFVIFTLHVENGKHCLNNRLSDEYVIVIVRPLSTVGYTSVARVIHGRQWSN